LTEILEVMTRPDADTWPCHAPGHSFKKKG
jgi:hypothetical protein